MEFFYLAVDSMQGKQLTLEQRWGIKFLSKLKAM